MKKSPSQKSALFIGRFQPFHSGHLDALKQVFKKEKHVIICIGSAEDDYVPDNPFTASERYQMIEAALNAAGVGRDTYIIIPARNIKHYSLWTRHIEHLLPPFGAVYTSSLIVKRLFNVERVHPVFSLKKNIPVSATQVRNLMLSGKTWEKFVPQEVVKLIKKWGGANRLKELKPEIQYK